MLDDPLHLHDLDCPHNCDHPHKEPIIVPPLEAHHDVQYFIIEVTLGSMRGIDKSSTDGKYGDHGLYYVVLWIQPDFVVKTRRAVYRSKGMFNDFEWNTTVKLPLVMVKNISDPYPYLKIELVRKFLDRDGVEVGTSNSEAVVGRARVPLVRDGRPSGGNGWLSLVRFVEEEFCVNEGEIHISLDVMKRGPPRVYIDCD